MLEVKLEENKRLRLNPSVIFQLQVKKTTQFGLNNNRNLLVMSVKTPEAKSASGKAVSSSSNNVSKDPFSFPYFSYQVSTF